LPLIEKVSRKHKRLIGGSWRMDETYIKVKGVWKYLYRAVDKDAKTIDFLHHAGKGIGNHGRAVTAHEDQRARPSDYVKAWPSSLLVISRLFASPV
jgi:hypothetical protein